VFYAEVKNIGKEKGSLFKQIELSFGVEVLDESIKIEIRNFDLRSYIGQIFMLA